MGAPVAVPACAAAYLILMVYGIGDVSGCHINPGVSTAVFIWQAVCGQNPNWACNWMCYVVAQMIGGTVGAIIAATFWDMSEKYDNFNAYGIFPYVGSQESAWVAMTGEMLAL